MKRVHEARVFKDTHAQTDAETVRETETERERERERERGGGGFEESDALKFRRVYILRHETFPSRLISSR